MTQLAPRISLITLGVEDVARATAFYEKLGWRKSAAASQNEISFIALSNLVISLFSRASLAEDAHLTDNGQKGSFSGISLAINLGSEAEVDAALALAQSAGAKLLKPGQKVFWGGYSGYFADPDGYIFEIAYNPFFPLNDQGLVVLPE